MISPELLPWALAAAFVLGSAVGIGSAFYLLSRSVPRLHAMDVRGVLVCDWREPGSKYLPPMEGEQALKALNRARLAGANVCPRCVDKLSGQ